MAEFAYRLATEGQSPGAQAAAVGIGLFIGCTPLYGIHLFLALITARLLGLSRIKMMAACMISIPVLAPFLFWGELQVGSKLVRGQWRAIRPGDLGMRGLGELGFDLIVGSLIVGVAIGAIGALIVWLVVPKGAVASYRRKVIERAAHRFLAIGYKEWWRTRRELFRHPDLALRAGRGDFAPGGRFLDLGCGDGALLAMVLEADEGRRPDRLLGVTLEAGVARQTEVALGSDVTMEIADPSCWPIEKQTAVVIWETRRRRAPILDDRLLQRIHDALEEKGSLIVAGLRGRMPLPAGENVEHLVDRLEEKGFEVEVFIGRPQGLRRPVLVTAKKVDSGDSPEIEGLPMGLS